MYAFHKRQHQDRLQELQKHNEGFEENGNLDSVQYIFQKFPIRSLGIVMHTNCTAFTQKIYIKKTNFGIMS